MKRIALALIRGYQLFLSPLVGSNCRFYPTCSHYAHEAISRHGMLLGGWLAVKRIGRCHPWAEGGVDPVPELAGKPCGCKDAAHLGCQQVDRDGK